MDLEHDRFDVTFDAGLVNPDELVAAIKKIGFDAVVVAPPIEQANDDGTSALDPEQLPDDLRSLLAQAAETEKTVLLQFTGPG